MELYKTEKERCDAYRRQSIIASTNNNNGNDDDDADPVPNNNNNCVEDLHCTYSSCRHRFLSVEEAAEHARTMHKGIFLECEFCPKKCKEKFVITVEDVKKKDRENVFGASDFPTSNGAKTSNNSNNNNNNNNFTLRDVS